jgi:hypothetical protein
MQLSRSWEAVTKKISQYFTKKEHSLPCSQEPSTGHYPVHTTAFCFSKVHSGRAIAQAVIRWLPTAVARVRARVWSSRICGQSGAGAGFLRVLRSPLPLFIPPNSASSQSSRGRYNRPFSGRRAEWSQYGLHPPLCELRRRSILILSSYQRLSFPSCLLPSGFPPKNTHAACPAITYALTW